MFQKYLSKKLIRDNLTDYSVFKDISDREYWGKMKNALEEELLPTVEHYDNYTFLPLYASLFRGFTTKQDRHSYEVVYYGRRTALNAYTFMEAFYNDGRYMEKIVDLLWLIMEETEWALPAHMHLNKTSDSLPYHKDPTLDLAAGETALALSFTYSLLKEKLDMISKNISIRMEEMIYERIIKNYLENDEYWYMGYYQDKVNNWNPWVNQNVFIATLTFAKDNKLKTDVIFKIMFTLNNYLKNYPDDGACDEGPVYWGHAGLKAIENLELLYKATNGAINLLKEEKTKGVSSYIYNAYIYNNRVVNFADSSSLIMLDNTTLYKFGKLLENEKLLGFAKYNYDLNKSEDKTTHAVKPRIFLMKFIYKGEYLDALEKEEAKYEFEKEVYFPSIGFWAVRSSKTDEKGLYLAAIGGNNGQSHNHNDVGNFIVYKDGEPFLIDSGNMSYTALTFNPETRYTIWTNISEYHNLPKINGKNQHQGAEYTSSDITFKAGEDKSVYSVNIKNAYENKDEINHWIRTISFDKVNNKIEVCEDYSLKKAESIVLNFLSYKPAAIYDGYILMTAENGASLKMYTDTSLFEIETETMEITDRILSASWGDKLYRIKLTLKETPNKNVISYSFE